MSIGSARSLGPSFGFRDPCIGRLVVAGLEFGAFALQFWGPDLVGGGVTGLFEGAPHIPGGDGAVGAPAFTEGQEFLRTGHVLFVVGDGPTFLYAEVVDGEHVGAAEAEDEEHFDSPGTDAADGDQTFNKLVVGEFQGFFVSGNDTVDGFLGEVLHSQDFCAGEAGFS